MKVQLRVSHHFLTSLRTLVTSPKRAGGSRFITVGGSGGMATRKMAPKRRKPRMGLGSQMKAESNGAFPLHGTVRFGTARYGSVRVGLRFHCSLVPL